MDVISRESHASFLDAELQAQIAVFQQKLEASAVALLESGELFVAQFIKFRGAEMMVMMNTERRGVPRRKDMLRAMVVIPKFQVWKNWGSLSYGELIKKGQINCSEAICIWHQQADDPKYTLVGFRGISVQFAEILEEGCFMVLGPPEPPFEYLQNLITVVNRTPTDSLAGKILDTPILANNIWLPTPITDRYNLIHQQLYLSDIVVIQGPPGTGKTYLLAQIAAQFLNEGKSVLVTALTHRALFELASKPGLNAALKSKRIFKKGLTLEDRDNLPELQEAENLFSSPGCLILATFYSSSGWSINIHGPIYDVVLVDEASQAFLAMLSASCLLAAKMIWIGDPAQLPPVVTMSKETVKNLKAKPLIYGMTTVLEQSSFPSFRLVNTYRLTERAAAFTGIFYQDTLKSVQSVDMHSLFPVDMPSDIQNFLNPGGGPVLLTLPLPPGDASPDLLIRVILRLVIGLMAIKESDLSIAILSKQKKTVSSVQWALAQSVGFQENIIVETVERVQGLTCDFCIFIIPDSSMGMSLDPNFFNVATSRARRHTIIVAPEYLVDSIRVEGQVATFIRKLIAEKEIKPTLYS